MKLIAKIGILSILLIFLPGSFFQVSSQTQPVTITVNLPAFQYESLAFSDVITEFEEVYPDIRVHLIRSETMQPFFVQSVENARQLATTADVLYIDSTMINPNVILSGSLLDLNPLIAVDETVDIDDFYPSAWESFQWDKGVWAVPLSFHPILLSYDPAAFDQIGLAYPDGNWTISNLAEAARSLTLRDAEGNVIEAGLKLPSSSEPWLLRSLLGENLFDETVYPVTPRLNTPTAAELLETWGELYDEGVTVGFSQTDSPISISLYLNEIDTHPNRAFALLPGGRAGIRLNGLAISAGTLYPEQAYEFVKFLSHHPQTLQLGRFTLPVRRSVETPQLVNNLNADVRELIMQSIPLSIPFHQIRYFEYFSRAAYRVGQGMTPQDALQSVEALAIQDQQRFLDQQNVSTISVIPPPIPEAIPEGKVTLRFGFHSYIAAVEQANQPLWDAVIEEFVAHDPEVGNIELEILINRVNFTENFDCFFTPNGIDTIEPHTLFNLDPLMAADTNFVADDFVFGALDQVMFNNQVYGYPLIIQFEVLDYDINAFQRAGVPLPTHDWTITDFVAALTAIKPQLSDNPVMGTTRFVATDLQQLIAAFGGLPIDYRTDPPTANFTDPTNVEAIRNVLDLVTAGYIQYLSQAGPYQISNFAAPIMSNSRSMHGSVSSQRGKTGSVLYPRGELYRPIAVGVGALYISNTTLYPEACYRWFNAIAANLGLVSEGMYATYSAINSPTAEAVQGASNIALYNYVAKELQAPDTIIIPSPWVGSGTFPGIWLEYWLYEAFSLHVFDGANLEQVLSDSQAKVDAYLECAGNLPEQDTSQDYMIRYQVHTECAASADPSIQTP